MTLEGVREVEVKTDLTIVICTRNRGDGLRATLESITAEYVSAREVAIDVVIVDNGSTDDTSFVADEWASVQRFPVAIVIEPQPGLARSRNRGIPLAKGDVIVMTDDDCTLEPGYFAAVLRAFGQEPGPAIIGGRIELGDVKDLPITIKTDLVMRTADPRSFPAGFVMGANLALTRSTFELVGPFDERFGAGAPFVAAEDTDFMLRATSLAVTLRYNPNFVVKHFHGRRTNEQARKLSEGYYFGDGALYAKHWTKDRRVKKAAYLDVKRALRDIIRPRTSQSGIRRISLFKARHRLRGYLAYIAAQRAS